MSQNTQDQPQQSPNLPPPQGETDQAEKYLRKLTELIESRKLLPSHTDLERFNINTLQDHYSLDLGDYEVEVSHTKQPDSGQDFYIMLFNNIRKVQSGDASCTDKLILAYIHLNHEQFKKFKQVADNALEQKRKEEEAKRFSEVMTPVENILEDLAIKSEPEVEPSKPEVKLNDEAPRDQEENEEPKNISSIPVSPIPQENFSSIPPLTS